MDPLVALVAGTGWGSGINLYLVTALLGIAGRFDLAPVPTLLTNEWVIGTAVVLFAIEFLADKVPYLDSVWDVAHTAVRPVGAALLGYVLTGDADGLTQLWATGGSGALALASHAAKATARAAINTSPEPVSNIGVSLGEDMLVGAVIWLAITNPLIAMVVVAVLVVIGLALTVALWRFIAGLRRRLRAHSPDRDAGGEDPPPGVDGRPERRA